MTLTFAYTVMVDDVQVPVTVHADGTCSEDVGVEAKREDGKDIDLDVLQRAYLEHHAAELMAQETEDAMENS